MRLSFYEAAGKEIHDNVFRSTNEWLSGKKHPEVTPCLHRQGADVIYLTTDPPQRMNQCRECGERF